MGGRRGVRAEQVDQRESSVAPGLYRISDNDQIGTGSVRERINRNLAAIRIVKQLEADQRRATPEEQQALVKYVGWGGLSRVFEPWKYGEEAKDNDLWRDAHDQLTDLLTDEEYQRARNSTQNAHYTSKPVVEAIWEAVQRLGVKGGSILEPSAGIGHFVGLAPDEFRKSAWALVEKDALTAAIAAALYPDAFTQNKPFENADLPKDHFALAISNVPFGGIPITDEAWDGPSFVRQRIHNYFFGKSLQYVAPGGLVAFVTTHGSLDSRGNTEVREYLASQADFLGAIRLPFTAFKSTAGTEVVTDIIFLRRRRDGEMPAHVAPWIETRPVTLKNKEGQDVELHVNEYMLDHPEMVLGTHTATGKMRQKDTYNVEPTGGLETQLRTAITLLPENVIDTKPTSTTLESFQQTLPPEGTRPFEYLLHEGRLAQVMDGRVTPITGMTQTDVSRIKDLLPVRTAVRALYDLMAEDGSDADLKKAQKELNTAYDRFVKRHGFISTDENWRAFHEDPDLPLVLSLEDYDAERDTATKTAIFTTRMFKADREALRAESPDHALKLTLAERGAIDLPRIGQLLDLTPDDAALKLQEEGLILDTPSGMELPARYLSGNVRVKLREAEAAAKLDPRYAGAAKALQAVIPADIPAHKINVRLGASWVSPEMVTDFVKEAANERYGLSWTITYNPVSAQWHVEGGPREHSSPKFETPDVDFKTVLMAALNDRRIVIKKRDAEKRTYVDQEATALARQKREDLHRAFTEWLFNEDPQRREWAVRTYNDRFNSYVTPKVDGSYLTFPGMAQYWREKIRPHQRDAAARVLLFGNTLLAHVVGSGKTLTMIAAGMEMRRLGLARKPLYVIPNHLIAQFPSEFLQHYPRARLLVAQAEDLAKENRKRFTARIASGDWDGVIMPYSAFARVSMSPEAEQAYYKEILDDIETAILDAWAAAQANESRKGGGRRNGKTPPSVKQLENIRDRFQAKLDKIAERPKDEMLWFEQLGVDALFVDELHNFKNLPVPTRQQAAGLPQMSDVQRAMDMYLKARHINKLSNYRNFVGASGTPVSNSMAEIYVMQKLLQEQALERAGIQTFDAWLAQFGLITSEMGVDPSGTGLSARDTLARFRNLPDLAAMFRQIADVKMIDDLPLIKEARPKLRGDAIESIEVPTTPLQQMYLAELKDRAEHLDPRDRRTDNMAKITVDGRMAMLDMRMIDRRHPDEPGSKINRVAKEVFKIWEDTTGVKGTQLVFLDLGTPGAEERAKQPKRYFDRDSGKYMLRPPTDAEIHRGIDLYGDLKSKLTRMGIPADQIAFAQDVDKVPDKKRDAARKSMYRKMREGTIRVLIGSTKRMGEGMNVQDRLVVSHNVDPTYKPSEIEQRNGRILRPGNLLAKDNPAFRIRILNYITQGKGQQFGYDAYMWQLNERKADIIARFFAGNLTERDLKLDLENTVLTASEMKAIATGNPLMLEEAKVRGEVERLELVRRGWDEARREASWKKAMYEEELKKLRQDIARREQTAEAVKPATDPFTATVGKTTIEGHKNIGEAIIAAAQKATEASKTHPGKWSSYTRPVDIGTIRGLKMWLDPNGTTEPHLVLRHPDDTPPMYGGVREDGQYVAQTYQLFSAAPDSPGGLEWRDATGLMRSVSNGIEKIGDTTSERSWIASRERAIRDADVTLNEPFPQQKDYEEAVNKLADLRKQLGVAQDQEVEQQDLGDGTEEGSEEEGEPSAEFMAKHVDTAGLEVDREALGRVLGSSLYSKNGPEVALKELVQNAADAVRGMPDGHVEVYLHPRSIFDEKGGSFIEVRDNGAGMTLPELKTYFLTLGGSGKREKGEASGGFGLAKAAPLLGGSRISVQTVAKIKSGLFGESLKRYSFEGTPDDVMAGRLKIYEEDVPRGTATGTDIMVDYDRDVSFSEYTLKEFLTKTHASTAFAKLTVYETPKSFSSQETTREKIGGMRTPHITLTTAPHLDFAPKFSTFPSQQFTLPGAVVDIHAEPTTDEPRLGVSADFYNNGLYQLTNALGHGIGMQQIPGLPARLHVNIKPTVAEGSGQYPFTANREQLNRDFDAELRKAGHEFLRPYVAAHVDMLKRSFSETPDIPGTDVKVFDAKGRLRDGDLRTLSAPEIAQMFKGITAVGREIIQALYPDRAARVSHLGVLLSDYNMGGVRIKEGIAKTSRMGVYVNPFVAEAQWNLEPSEDDPSTGVAKAIYHLLLHEITHLKASTEGPEFTWELFRNDTRIGQSRGSAFVRAIQKAIADDADPTQLSGAFREAGAVNQAIVGRPRGRTSPLVEGALRIHRPEPEPERARAPLADTERGGGPSRRPETLSGERGVARLNAFPIQAVAHDVGAVQAVLAPHTVSPEARLAGADLSAHIAARDQQIGRAHRMLESIRRAMDGWSKDESLDFIDVMEGEQPITNLPEDRREIARLFRGLIEDWTNEVTSRNLIRSYIENYFPHIWKRPESIEGAFLRRLLGRRPLAGTESYRRKRTIPTTREGIDIDLEPVSWNPAVLLEAKIIEMARSVMAYDLRRDWTKYHGLRRFVPAGKRHPEGWVLDRDRGPVFGPREVTIETPETESGEATGKPKFGRLVAGNYYLHPDAARLLDRFQSRGLYGRSMIFDAYNTIGNLFTQTLLGWSTFHLWMTGIESTISKANVALALAARGEGREAIKKFAQVGPQGVVHDLVRGYRIVKEFYSHNGDANDIAGMIGQIINGGGGFTWSRLEYNDAVGKFEADMRSLLGALHRGEPSGAAVGGLKALAHAPLAAIELPTKLIMEHWVPYLKASAFMDLAEMEMRRLDKLGATLEQRRYALQRAWTIIDDRFGQLRYDNLFWNNAWKHGLMGSFLSVGWNVGSLRPMGRALPGQAKRLARAAAGGAGGAGGGKPPRRPRGPSEVPGGRFEPAEESPLHPDASWIFTGALLIGMAGAVYHYLHTGRRPKSIRDLYYPEDGTGHRRMLISYVKDYVAWPLHPLTTLGHKLRPILTMLYETYTNEDFFGVEVRNPNDPPMRQLAEVLESWIKRASPISWEQAVRTASDDSFGQRLKEWAEQQVSPFRPAPAEIERSKAEQMVHEWGARDRTIKTREQADRSALTRQIRKGLAARTPEGREAANAAIRSGDLTRGQIKTAIRSGVKQESYLQYGMTRASFGDALTLYETATLEERATLRGILMKKAHTALLAAARNERQSLYSRYQTAIRLPYARP